MPAPSSDFAHARRLAEVALAPWRALTDPVFLGLEQVPRDRPVILVGNHTTWGVLDAPLLGLELARRHGIWVRGLGHHLHFRIPVWRHLVQAAGIVDGTPERASRLMARGAPLLVFPGGGREVAKRKGEKYQLLWKERVGFARLAARFGYTIVPFSAVGAEEMYDIVLDGHDLLRSPLGPRLERLHPDLLMPIVRGLGPTPLPRPERLYFRIARPIDARAAVAAHGGDAEDPELWWALRRATEAAVREGLDELLELQRTDPHRRLGARLLRDLRRLPGRPRAPRPRRDTPAMAGAAG